MTAASRPEHEGPTVELSVIVPVLDVGTPLVQQLDALLRQEHSRPWEVVLADNGSTDGTTLDIARAYARVHPDRVRLVDASAVRGKSAAINTAVRAAHGRLIAMCDGDDVVAPGWVSAMARSLSEHAFVCGPLEYGQLNPAWAVRARGGGPDQVTGPLFIEGGPPWPFALGANLGVRREAHEAVGGFDEELTYGGEDCDYAWKLAEAGVALHFEPAAVVHYRNRTDLRGIHRQARAYAASHIRLLGRWEHVWPVPPAVPDRRTRLRQALRTVRQARSRGALGQWVWNLGWFDGYAWGTTLPPLTPLSREAYGRSGHLRP